jgi:membrane protein implicated in regulation of membrane protease activity
MDEPEQWRWIWLGAAVIFGIGEMATPGAFFLAPFAVGAGVAAILAFAGVAIVGEWAAFVLISVAAFMAMRPLARRLDREHGSEGIGSRRLIGRPGVVIEPISATTPGLVRIDSEEWRAESADHSPIAQGEGVRITEVTGTRVIVAPSKEHQS